MNTSIQSNSNYQIGLNVHLLSFLLPNNLIHESDSVRVGVTTIPEGNKQHFKIKGKKICSSNHVFSLNITNKTDRIVIVFRKKTALKDDPIIASATIHLKDFAELPIQEITSGTTNTDVKILDIYYPLQKQIHEEQKANERQNLPIQNNTEMKKQIKRKVLGQMEVQLSFTTPYLKSEQEKTNNKEKKAISMKINKNRKQRKNEEYKQISEENNTFNYSLI
ncbi:hypothetical protein M9Y10_015793 [Tritrichomonas musculus]|uniref:MSP domain-containing protein n=1 Tax=Tritrichomonas musculus TaxID=1915356 RepID=A0ABR2I5Y1_9EUKA